MSNKESTKDQSPDDAPDFERSLEELEKLVEALESGELSLNDSLDRFKRGIELSKRCHHMLDRARETVEILNRPEDEDSGQPF